MCKVSSEKLCSEDSTRVPSILDIVGLVSALKMAAMRTAEMLVPTTHNSQSAKKLYIITVMT